MRLGALGLNGIAERLSRGLSLQTGPFRYLVQSQEPMVAHGLASLYADFPLDPGGGFHDFHVRVDRVQGLRRWLRPQASFWVDGVEPFKPLPAAHAFALLEWGMNWCVAGHAHHYLLVHSAVLEREGRSVLLPGDPGAGKSTLTAALMLRGWRLLSDEMAVLDRDDGLLLPTARPISLKNRSIDVIAAWDANAVFGETAHDTHKGSVTHLRPTRNSVDRMAEKGRAAHIVFPRWRAGASTRLEPRSKADAFMRTAAHAFNYSLLGRRGFELQKSLIDACRCWSLEYEQLDEALHCFDRLAEMSV